MATQDPDLSWRARFAELESRIAKLEDELGITERNAARVERAELVALYRAHGFSKASARNLTHAALKRGVSLAEATKWLAGAGNRTSATGAELHP